MAVERRQFVARPAEKQELLALGRNDLRVLSKDAAVLHHLLNGSDDCSQKSGGRSLRSRMI
jgi:hypothetical protein